MSAERPALMVCTLVLLVVSIGLGGATQAGFVGDPLIEFASVPVLALAALAVWGRPWKPAAVPRFSLVVTLIFLAVPLLQIVPSAGALRQKLGGGQAVLDDLRLAASSSTLFPVSISPEATWNAWASLLPAVAMFWAVAVTGWPQRRCLVGVLLVLGAGSAILGGVQMAQGPSSGLRFYHETNADSAVGFFANRNHFSAFLYCVLIFCGAQFSVEMNRWRNIPKPEWWSADRLLPATVLLALLFGTLAIQAMTASRAGAVLSAVGLVAIVSMCAPAGLGRGRSAGSGMLVRAGMFAVLILMVAAVADREVLRLADRFALQDAQRLKFFDTTLLAVRDYLPWGSGLGTFVYVYPAYEKAQDLIPGQFANRAHNDWLEFVLELGVAGGVLAALFAIWMLLKVWRSWGRDRTGQALIDLQITRAASLSGCLLLVHSIVDYPLRTAALATVMGMVAGLLITPPAGIVLESMPTAGEKRRSRGGSRGQRRTGAGADYPDPLSPASNLEAQRPLSGMGGERWGDHVDWPESWTSGKQDPPKAADRMPRSEGPPANPRADGKR